MKLSAIASTLLLAGSVSADYLSAKSRHTGNNVDLGHLHDVHGFYSVIGHNGTGWQDVTEFETFEEEEEFQSLNPASPTASGLARRDDGYCSDLTGITKMVCDNVPSRWWFWGAGGGLAIYYSPTVIVKWLNEVAEVIKAGRNLRNVYYNQQPHDELKRRDENLIDYHFSLPYLLDHQGKVNKRSIKRNVSPDNSTAELKHDYVYSERDGILYYKASTLFFSPGSSSTPAQNGTSTLQTRSNTKDYTINMIISKHTSANTIASTSCLASMLKYHLDASSEKGRFSCRPIDNKGSWRATMHLMINKGTNNRGTYGTCCD